MIQLQHGEYWLNAKQAIWVQSEFFVNLTLLNLPNLMRIMKKNLIIS